MLRPPIPLFRAVFDLQYEGRPISQVDRCPKVRGRQTARIIKQTEEICRDEGKAMGEGREGA